MAAFGWLCITVILGKIFPVVIIPMFYKYKDIENTQICSRINNLLSKNNIKIKSISQINLSKDTKKANAALVGIGSTKRVLLADTLLSNYSPDEIEVVFAHELGHFKLRHIPKLIFLSAVTTVIGLYLVNIILKSAAIHLGFSGIYDIAGMPLILLSLTILGFFIMPIQNGYSRLLERQADIFAIKNTGLKDAFISSMEKLATQNLSDVAPSKIIEFLFYDHPPISKRIKLANAF